MCAVYCVVNMVAQCDISTTANSTVTLKCPLSSAPNSVIWMKSDHRVETDSSYTVHNNNGSLRIDKVGEFLRSFIVNCLLTKASRIKWLFCCCMK